MEIKRIVELSDMKKVPKELYEFWDHFEQMLVRREFKRFDREFDGEYDRMVFRYPAQIRESCVCYNSLMIRRRRWA